jgi:fructose-bisphosphate aldolase, class I
VNFGRKETMPGVNELHTTASSLVPPTKGILAADESLNSTARRFARFGIPHTAENRRLYRSLLFTTPGLEKHLSGVIMFDESIRQQTDEGIPFPEYLAAKGILTGIKVDAGFYDMAGFPGEKITGGLDGLADRLAEYKSLGAVFAKWRAVITIGPGIPSRGCLAANAHALARYAITCQEAGIVPIVEPDVILAGDYDLERGQEVTAAMLVETFTQLYEQRVDLEGILLKPNMVLAGVDCPRQPSLGEAAQATVGTFLRTVPAAVPGIVFLSGGQGAELSAARLNQINQIKNLPWELSFSYLRGLADPSFDCWQGIKENFLAAQQVFYKRVAITAAARQGLYRPEMEYKPVDM